MDERPSFVQLFFHCILKDCQFSVELLLLLLLLSQILLNLCQSQ